MPKILENKPGATIISEEYPDTGYLVIPYALLASKSFTMIEKIVLSMIKGFVDNGQKFIASNGYIARRTGYSVNKVRSALKVLEDNKMIIRYMVGHSRSHIELGGGCIKMMQGGVSKSGRGGASKSGTYTQGDNLDINKRKLKNFSFISKTRREEQKFNAKRQVALNKVRMLKFIQ